MKYKSKNSNIVISPLRFERGFHVLNEWLKLKIDGKTLESFFTDNEYKRIAVYGLGALGERLCEELKPSELELVYAIDRIAEAKKNMEMKVYSANEEKFQDVDVIVVTPVQDFWLIEQVLEQKTNADIVSLEDVVAYCGA